MYYRGIPGNAPPAQGDDPETTGVSKISGRKVTLAAPVSHWFQRTRRERRDTCLQVRAASGVVRMEEAGDDNTLTGTDDDDSREDA